MNISVRGDWWVSNYVDLWTVMRKPLISAAVTISTDDPPCCDRLRLIRYADAYVQSGKGYGERRDAL